MTPGLPTKDDLIEAGVFHPNCTHSYAAVSDHDRETRFDRDGKPLPKEEAEEKKAQRRKANLDWIHSYDKKRQAEKAAKEEARKAVEEAEKLKEQQQDVKTAAEHRLEQIPGVEKVDFDGWKDEDGIKAVADQLERLSNEYDVPPPFSRFTVQQIIDGRTGTISDNIGGVTINGDNSPNGIKGQVSLNIKVLERIPEFRAILDTDTDGRYIGIGCFLRKGHEVECLATHEFGHRIINEFDRRGELQKVANYIEMVFRQHTKGFGVGANAVDVSSEVSKYAASNWMEFWSECLSIYKCGDKERLPRDIRYMVGNVLSAIRKDNPIPVSKLEEVAKAFRKEYKAIRNQHADISRFWESRVVVDTAGSGKNASSENTIKTEVVAPVSTEKLPSDWATLKIPAKREVIAENLHIQKGEMKIVQVADLRDVVFARSDIDHCLAQFKSELKDALLLNPSALLDMLQHLNANFENETIINKPYLDQVRRYTGECVIDGKPRKIEVVVFHYKKENCYRLYHISVFK